jgi:hypothetical protein
MGHLLSSSPEKFALHLAFSFGQRNSKFHILLSLIASIFPYNGWKWFICPYYSVVFTGLVLLMRITAFSPISLYLNTMKISGL